MFQPLVLATALLLPSQPQSTYSWEPFSDGDDTQVKLMYNNHQVGVLVLATGLYYRCDPSRHSIDVQPSEPPCTLPLNRGPRNMGIVTNKMPTSERYEINGQSVHRDQVARALGAGIPDDSNKQSVVAVGSKADTDRLSTIWLSDPAFAPYRDSTLFQAHDNTYWWIVQHGLTPGIWVFSQEGTALHHQADLNPDTLAMALRTIQVKPDPNFRPDQVPDLSTPPSPSLSPSQWLEHPQHIIGLTLALLIIAGLAVYIHSKNARSS